jgi:hypothetical protein
LPPTDATTSWPVHVMISRQTSSIAWMLRQASTSGLDAASMTCRWMPLANTSPTSPPRSTSTRVSWPAATRSAAASRSHWPVDMAPL